MRSGSGAARALRGAELEAVIVNTAGGMAGGDRFASTSTVEPGARLVVTTAAAEKVYRTLGPDATIDVRLAVGCRRLARLAAAGDDPVRPGAALRARSRSISPTMRGCCWPRRSCSDAPAWARRSTRAALFDRWRVRRDGRLIHAEALRLDGAVAAKLAAPAIAKGGVAVATVLIVPGDDAIATRRAGARRRFRGEVGVSAWNGFAVVRLCAADGAALRHDLGRGADGDARRALPRLWLN